MTNDDEPIPLIDACRLFPQAKLKVWTLRAAAANGRLEIFRLGRRDYTTPKSMRDWVRKCQDDARRHVSTSTEAETSGLSETDQASSAQAALSQTVEKLKKSLLPISEKNTNRRVGQTH